HLIDYIIATTHPTHVDFRLKRNIWKRQLKDSYQNTQFLNLTILDVINGPYESFVTFKADLKNENQDGSFTEKSRFLKEGDRWFYVDGVISH
ncbi:MAG: hypothetical protein JHC93_05280, partial [Parachlamydiales bacterium]|nr:hypothetical protein [Parachlamydiales bacterium]